MKIPNYTPNPDAFMEAMERQVAEGFLNHGTEPDGFDMNDPKVRAELVNRPLKEFVDFEVNPVPPELAAMLEKLDEAPDYEAAYSAICAAAEALYQLPPGLICTIYPSPPKNALWIFRKPGTI
jgi:hypothetical protein